MASIEDIAREVIAGKWGSGASRKENLVNSGYDYSAVQSAVNSMMGNGGGSSSGVSTKNYDSDGGGGIDSEISSMENQLFGIENRRKSEAPTYTSKFQSQIDNLNGILESRRNAFNYNAEDDPLYQQYAKDYTRRGQQAMEDTLGKVSARTGGLASSYATTASEQAYNNYMSELASKIPELQQLAKQMYDDETNAYTRDRDYYQNLENTEYSRYRDALNDFNSNLDREYTALNNNLNILRQKKAEQEAAAAARAKASAKAKEDDDEWYDPIQTAVDELNDVFKNMWGTKKYGGRTGGF